MATYKFGKKEEEAARYGKKRADLPDSYFLMPKERKFPYKTADGKISKKLLMAAYKRARQWGYTQVAAKAKRLLKRHFGFVETDGIHPKKKKWVQTDTGMMKA